MAFCRRYARKWKFRNDTIRATVDLGKNILEVNEEKRLMAWIRKENDRK
jgi:hypothetical protein